MLIGRSAETATIDELLAGARDGRSGALVIRGEAGVGKSALLEHAAAAATGFRVLRGVSVEVESELAYAALHQILRPVFDRIDRLPGVQATALRAAFALSTETVDERFRVSLGVLGLLSEAAEDEPLLCVVDDAQWLDQASADALLFAARRLEAESIVLLFAARDDDARPFVAHGLPELRVPPLSTGDSRALLTERLGSAVAAGALDWLVESANGNPLALVELPVALTAPQLAGRDSLAGTLPPATSVEHVYLERVDALPPATRALVVLAAAEEAGARRTIARAAKSLGLRLDDLAAAESAGLLHVEGDRVLFRHPLVRSAVYRACGFAERERAHRALAVASDDEGSPDRAAWHRAAATVGTDDDAALALEETADRARLRSGYAAAAAALDRAAELTTATGAKARRYVAAANAAWHAGHAERATALLDRARPLVAEPRLSAELDHLRGVIEWRCGAVPDGCATLLRGAAEIAPVDTAKALEMLVDAGTAAWDAGDFARLVEVGERAAAMPDDGSEEHAFLARVLAGVGALVRAEMPRDLPIVLDGIARSAEADDPQLLMWAAVGASVAGEEEVERALLRRAASLARASGSVGMLTLVLEGVTVQGFLAGQFTVTAEAAEGLALAREAGLTNAATLHLASLAWLAAAQGRDDECRAYAAEVADAARSSGHGLAHAIAEWGVGMLDLSTGAAEAAATRLVALARAAPGLGHPYYALTSAPDLVEAAVRAGRDDVARTGYALLEDFARPDAPAWMLARAARCRALLADDEDAEREFEDALRLHPDGSRPFDRARTQLLYGEFLRRRRRRGESRAHLRAAVEVFDELGAVHWADRAGGELRATGETARRRAPETLLELTPQELQIARLVAGGGSNKEVAAQLFLSPRTVEYHLRKVFTKLGVASRAELIRRGVGEGEPAAA